MDKNTTILPTIIGIFLWKNCILVKDIGSSYSTLVVKEFHRSLLGLTNRNEFEK